jgi:hypothetical protein
LKKCKEYRLPVTTHCSDSGYNAVEKAIDWTDPQLEWKTVLSNSVLKGLRFNYAHFGASKYYKKRKEQKETWRNEIIDQMISPDIQAEVYSDISSLGHESDFFTNTLPSWGLTPEQEDRVLYGSDFMINLLECDSYNQYLGNLATCSNLVLKQKICVDNPEKFLFGS